MAYEREWYFSPFEGAPWAQMLVAKRHFLMLDPIFLENLGDNLGGY